MKKYYFVICVLVSLIIFLICTLFIVQSNKNYEINPEWGISQDDEYIFAIVQTGDIKNSIWSESRTQLEYGDEVLYKFENVNVEDLLVEKNDIINCNEEIIKNNKVLNKNKGVITDIIYENGDIVVSIKEIKFYYTTVYVPQINANDVHQGQEVNIWYNGTPFQGIVEKVNNFINDEGNLSVKIKILDSTVILPNSFINVEIVTFLKENILRVPYEAIFLKENLYYVNVYEDGRVIEKKVELGIIGYEFVEIKHGLTINERVILGKYE